MLQDSLSWGIWVSLNCVLGEKSPYFFSADSLVHFHVLLVAETASQGDQLGPLHFNQELSEGEEEEGSWLFSIFFTFYFNSGKTQILIFQMSISLAGLMLEQSKSIFWRS